MTSPETTRKQSIRVYFDLDGTLYTYDQTGFLDAFDENALVVFKNILPELSANRREFLACDYYGMYGEAFTGLVKEHMIDKASGELLPAYTPLDLISHLRTSVKCPYDRLGPNPALKVMLDAMRTDDGCDLWILTNGDAPHALACTERVGITSCFEGLSIAEEAAGLSPTSSADGTTSTAVEPCLITHTTKEAGIVTYHLPSSRGYFKCVDCYDQWGPHYLKHLSSMVNKPFVGAYVNSEAKANAYHTMVGTSAPNKKVDKLATIKESVDGATADDDATVASSGAACVSTIADDTANCTVTVLVEDNFTNLKAPTLELGWVTVWVSCGRPMPTEIDGVPFGFTPCIVIERIEDLREALAKHLLSMGLSNNL